MSSGVVDGRRRSPEVFFRVSSLRAKKQVARTGQPRQEAIATATRTTRAADRVVVRLEVEVALVEVR
jgi:hypothetical protein